jgi:hypothetical protein
MNQAVSAPGRSNDRRQPGWVSAAVDQDAAGDGVIPSQRRNVARGWQAHAACAGGDSDALFARKMRRTWGWVATASGARVRRFESCWGRPRRSARGFRAREVAGQQPELSWPKCPAATTIKDSPAEGAFESELSPQCGRCGSRAEPRRAWKRGTCCRRPDY